MPSCMAEIENFGFWTFHLNRLIKQLPFNFNFFNISNWTIFNVDHPKDILLCLLMLFAADCRNPLRRDPMVDVYPINRVTNWRANVPAYCVIFKGWTFLVVILNSMHISILVFLVLLISLDWIIGHKDQHVLYFV